MQRRFQNPFEHLRWRFFAKVFNFVENPKMFDWALNLPLYCQCFFSLSWSSNVLQISKEKTSTFLFHYFQSVSTLFGSIYAIYKKWDNLTNLQINLSNSTKIADKTVMLPSPIFRREVKLICYRKSWNTILRKKVKQSKEHLYLRFYVYTHASMCR